MPRFKLTIEYDGSPYVGWQFQKNKPTIMGVLMDGCKSAFGVEKFELYGAGRTDSGVHALAQVAHLDIEPDFRTEEVRMKLNDKLPPTVNIRWVESVDNKFHARYDAIARSYIYHISARRTAFGKKYAWWIKDYLDISKMNTARKQFLGMHDFCSFGSSEDEKASTKVQIDHISINKYESSILIHIVGSHFLWKMIRRMVGILAECGRGNMTFEDVKNFLTAYSDIPAKYTAPPSGLFLDKVFYEKLPAKYDLALPIFISD